LRRRRSLEVGIRDRDATVVLLYAINLRVVSDDIADFPGKRLADHVHAAYRLKHRGLEVIIRKALQITPDAGLEDVRQIDRLARDRRGAEPTAGIPSVTTKVSGNEISLVRVIAVQCAP
jgi:hypothetical protein